MFKFRFGDVIEFPFVDIELPFPQKKGQPAIGRILGTAAVNNGYYIYEVELLNIKPEKLELTTGEVVILARPTRHFEYQLLESIAKIASNGAKVLWSRSQPDEGI